jgi:hypothetical protein
MNTFAVYGPHSWFWHKAKKQFFDQIYNKSKILTISFIVKYEKNTHFDEFLVLLGPIISMHVQMSKKKQQRVLALVLSLWDKHSSLLCRSVDDARRKSFCTTVTSSSSQWWPKLLAEPDRFFALSSSELMASSASSLSSQLGPPDSQPEVVSLLPLMFRLGLFVSNV